MARTQSRGELRRIPSVDSLLRTDAARRACEKFGRPLVKLAVQAVLGDARSALERGVEAPDDEILLARALRLTALNWYGLSTVLNATGVILHTGLGRAPLPERAARAAADAARNYVDLEVDREQGIRGRRTTKAETMLVALTGAEAALVVNNNAAALLLVLAGLARRREVPVSRGELIEIGGEFRLPDIMAASGAKLVEVGTTNRTRLADFGAALNERTGAVPKVHPSNQRAVGFAETPRPDQPAGPAPRLYTSGRREELRVWHPLKTPSRELKTRAARLAREPPGAQARKSEGAVGGGSVPGYVVPSWAVEVCVMRAETMAARLREG